MIARRLLPLLVVLFAFTACNGINNPVDLGPTVRGTVTDAATNAFIPEARVTVGIRTGMTNPNGAFFIMDLQKGTHTMTVEKTGYVTYTATVTVDETLGERNVKLVKQ